MKKIELFEKDIKEVVANTEWVGAKLIILREYTRTEQTLKTDTLVLQAVLWDEHYEDALAYMEEAGLEEIIIVNATSELMELLHFFMSEGCEVIEAVNVESKNATKWDKPLKGLRIKFPKKNLVIEREENMPFGEAMDELKKLDWDRAVVVFATGNWDTKYTEKERSYNIASTAKYFNPNMNGKSLFGDCLDGKDLGVRLDLYTWEVEKIIVREMF